MHQAKRPNILIVMTDHQRLDTVLAEHPCLTPNLTRLAEEGVSFMEVYPPMAHCCPARASFFSGLYPSRHGVWNNVNNAYAINQGPHDHIRMFSQDLREAGYDLAYAGKWHVSALGHQTPAAYGWRELQEYAESIEDTGHKWEKLREQAKVPDSSESIIQVPGYQAENLYGAAEWGGRTDERTTELAIKALPELAATDQPWALFVGYVGPHTPYKVPQRYLDMYNLDEIPLPPSFADTMDDKPDYYGKLRRASFDQLGEARTRDAIRHFWAMCTQLDELFGQIVTTLEETGQAEDTLVIYCADHGDYAGEHGLFHKQVPSFLGAYRVPAVCRWPAGIAEPGRRVDALVSLADFAPTFLDVAGVRINRYFTGRSLLPFLQGDDPTDWRQEICTQCEGTENYFTQRMVISRTHKYVYNGFARDELYDLVDDPHEMVNRIDDPAYAEVVRDLVGRMWRFAYQEQDRLGSTQYVMVNTAPYGPLEGFRSAPAELPQAVPLGSENDPTSRG